MGIAQDFVSSYLAAWNHRDPRQVAEHFCSDGHYIDVPTQLHLSGDALLAHLEEYFDRTRHRYELVGEILVNDNTLAFQYRACPLQAGSADPGWGGAEFIQLDGLGARSINDYYRLPTPGRASAGRYAKSGLSEACMAGLLEQLEALMARERLFLDPSLSLPRLARRLGCSVNHLSQALNAGHGMSFFDYVNGLRIREAQDMLRGSDAQRPAILDVALAVGFNSTSTFYTAFKKATGQTPARYRRGD